MIHSLGDAEGLSETVLVNRDRDAADSPKPTFTVTEPIVSSVDEGGIADGATFSIVRAGDDFVDTSDREPSLQISHVA